jgi:SAM-dependent methyltransferase
MGGTQGYEENAIFLAQQYESITFADLHRDVLHLFPPPPSRILDIGAGSGRDAAALAMNGHQVVAVEPTDALRKEGMRRHAGTAIDWVDDQLPRLSFLQRQHTQFDLLLLTAVWMHLDEEERQVGMASVSDLLKPGGRASMSLRHGPVPEGRRMFEVSVAETTMLAERFGLRAIHTAERDDVLGRKNVRWSFVVFEKERI